MLWIIRVTFLALVALVIMPMVASSSSQEVIGLKLLGTALLATLISGYLDGISFACRAGSQEHLISDLGRLLFGSIGFTTLLISLELLHFIKWRAQDRVTLVIAVFGFVATLAIGHTIHRGDARSGLSHKIPRSNQGKWFLRELLWLN